MYEYEDFWNEDDYDDYSDSWDDEDDWWDEDDEDIDYRDGWTDIP